jgi:hypothetical protein
VYTFAKDAPLDVEAFRTRLKKMTDADLLRYGRAGRYLCSPKANFWKPPRETFVVLSGAVCVDLPATEECRER